MNAGTTSMCLQPIPLRVLNPQGLSLNRRDAFVYFNMFDTLNRIHGLDLASTSTRTELPFFVLGLSPNAKK